MLARRIKDDIDAYCATTYDDGPRKHLGASLIGHECSRYLWYVFRWCYHKKHDGRQQRLFNRGHREEDRFIEWLRGIGCTVWNEDANGKQIRIDGVMGHFGGSMDGVMALPVRYGVTDCAAFLSEFKTSGTGKKFTDLIKNGVKVEKPQHYAQMSTYGRKMQFKFGLYMCINKNDDDLYVEIVQLDWSFAADLERKAEVIILSQTPPKKLSESKAYQTCSYCDMRHICHERASVDRNCRSCSFAQPIDGGQWVCNHPQAAGGVIPADFIPKACPQYNPIA